MAAISGWGGRVRFSTAGAAISSGTAMPVTRWTVNDRADAVDTTTMEHQGFYDAVSGVNEFDISFECFYDTNVSPFATTPSLSPGASNSTTTAPASTYASMTLTLDTGTPATRSWYFSRVLITDLQMDDEVRGVVRYTCQGKATRGATFALGTVPTMVGPGSGSGFGVVPTASPG